MEWAVDVDLFLSAQNHWAANSPHHLMILHEMFLHAPSEGQKDAEQSDPQKRGQPHLLGESVVELREEIGFYLAFQDEEVFQGLDLPEEEDAHPVVAAAAVTEIENITDIPEASPAPWAVSKYAGWEMVLHPS